MIDLYEYNIGQKDTVTEIEATYVLDKQMIRKNNFQLANAILVEPWLYGVKIDNIEDERTNFTIYKAILDTADLLYTADFERLEDIISDNDKMDKYLDFFSIPYHSINVPENGTLEDKWENGKVEFAIDKFDAYKIHPNDSYSINLYISYANTMRMSNSQIGCQMSFDKVDYRNYSLKIDGRVLAGEIPLKGSYFSRFFMISTFLCSANCLHL